jgi:hypothetical protein
MHTPTPAVARVSPSASQTAASPLPSPVRSTVLAIVAGPKSTTVSLVASNGPVVATAKVDPAPFRAHALMSWTSASRTRLYYLNAGTEVRFIAPDGTSGTSTRITLATNEQAGFSVSPDDTRIAVAILTFGANAGEYKGMRLYVENLVGGGGHVDIFASPTVAEFPIGWTGGRLVMAVSTPTCCQAATLNPYDATSYHVVDPATGNRLVSLCEGTPGPEGPVEPIGAVCFPGGRTNYQRWVGGLFPEPALLTTPIQYGIALAPDGTRGLAGHPEGVTIEGPDGQWTSLAESGYALGWLDADRFVDQRDLGTPLRIYDLTTGSGAYISSSDSAYLGTFPPAIS